MHSSYAISFRKRGRRFWSEACNFVNFCLPFLLSKIPPILTKYQWREIRPSIDCHVLYPTKSLCSYSCYRGFLLPAWAIGQSHFERLEKTNLVKKFGNPYRIAAQRRIPHGLFEKSHKRAGMPDSRRIFYQIYGLIGSQKELANMRNAR